MKYPNAIIGTDSFRQIVLNLINPVLLIVVVFRLIYKVHGYQDSETLIQAARAIFARVNPYDSDFFLNGYVLAIPFQMYSHVFSASIGARIYALFNLALIAIVIWEMFGKSETKKFLTVMVCVFASSPTRAMIASVQHTGLIIGFTYLSFKIATSNNEENLSRNYRTILISSLFILVPLEMKPQLVLPLLGLYLFNRKLRSYGVTTLSVGLISHIAFSSFFHMPLDKFWLARLSARSSETTASGTRENSPWSLFGSLVGHSSFWFGLSSVIFICLVVYFWLHFRESKIGNKEYVLALLLPLVLTYVHPYDLVFPGIIVAISFISGKKGFGGTILLFLFLLPTIDPSLSSIFLAISVYFVTWLGATTRISLWRKDLLELICAAAIYISINTLTQDVGLRVNLQISLLIIGSLIFLSFELLRTSTKST